MGLYDLKGYAYVIVVADYDSKWKMIVDQYIPDAPAWKLYE